MIFNSPEWQAARNENLLAWMKQDMHAVAFLLDIFNAAEVWDDLLDGDAIESRTFNDLFMRLLFDLPNNMFYQRHMGALQPLMMAGVNAWMDANELQKRDDEWAVVWAYTLRDWYMELCAYCAYIVGGFEHMRAVSLPMREFFQKETLEQFKTDLRTKEA